MYRDFVSIYPGSNLCDTIRLAEAQPYTRTKKRKQNLKLNGTNVTFHQLGRFISITVLGGTTIARKLVAEDRGHQKEDPGHPNRHSLPATTKEGNRNNFTLERM